MDSQINTTFDFKEGEILLVNKPLRWTSFDIVGKIRSCIGEKNIKVGHAGTLDPLAEGLLLIFTGKKTKEIDRFQDLDKEYQGSMYLGATRPSIDLETEIDAEFPYNHITKESIEEKIKDFIGKIWQTSPIYSARRINGQRAYTQARLGETLEIKPREITVYEFTKLDFNQREIRFKIRCSKGTYIRSLVRDLGKALGSGAYLSQLTRTKIGNYSLEDAWDMESLCQAILDQKNVKKIKLQLQVNKQINMFPQETFNYSKKDEGIPTKEYSKQSPINSNPTNLNSLENE